VVGNVMVPEFAPRQGVKIQVRENENVSEQAGNDANMLTLCILQH
jgi:hypothetical protein